MNEVTDKVARIRRFLNKIESFDLDQLTEDDKQRLREQAVGIKDAANFLYFELMEIVEPGSLGGDE